MKLIKQIAGLTAGLLLFGGTAAQGATYTVKPGDSLWTISLAHQTTIAELKKANKLHSDMIVPGQNLQVPGPTPYTVQNNETMWIISQKFGITLDALIKAIRKEGYEFGTVDELIPKS